MLLVFLLFTLPSEACHDHRCFGVVFLKKVFIGVGIARGLGGTGFLLIKSEPLLKSFLGYHSYSQSKSFPHP